MDDTQSSIKQDTLKDLESFLSFRRALRRQDQLVLDNLYQKASFHFAAPQSVEHALPFEVLLLSMLLEEHKEVERLRQEYMETLGGAERHGLEQGFSRSLRLVKREEG